MVRIITTILYRGLGCWQTDPQRKIVCDGWPFCLSLLFHVTARFTRVAVCLCLRTWRHTLETVGGSIWRVMSLQILATTCCSPRDCVSRTSCVCALVQLETRLLDTAHISPLFLCSNCVAGRDLRRTSLFMSDVPWCGAYSLSWACGLRSRPVGLLSWRIYSVILLVPSGKFWDSSSNDSSTASRSQFLYHHSALCGWQRY